MTPPDAPAPPSSGVAARVLGAARRGAVALLRRARGSSAGALRSARAGARFLWDRRPPASRAVAIVFLVALGASGVGGLLFQAGLPERLPDALDWAALRALVERDARPGDAIAIAPAWAERARLVAPASVPVLPRASWDDEDLPGVKRVWLVSLPSAPGFSWDMEKALLARASRNDPPLPLGALEVTRSEVASPELPLAFLPDRLARAEVRLGETPCARDAGRFRCPAAHGAEVEVSRTVREVDGAPRPCLTAPADAGAGAALVVTFPAVPVGRALRGHVGVAGDAPRASGAAVRISVRIDGQEAGAADVTGAGWPAFDIDTSPFAGRVRELALVVATTGPTGPLCLDAVTLP